MVPWPGWESVVEGADLEVGVGEAGCEVAKVGREDVEPAKVDVIFGTEAGVE